MSKPTTIQHSRRTRVILALALIFVWLGIAGIGGPYFGRIEEVSSNDLSTFLPASSESTEVKEELEKFQDTSSIPAIVVFESDEKLTTTQRDEITEVKDALQEAEVVKGDVSAPIISDNELAAFLLVPLDSNSEFDEAIDELKEAVHSVEPSVSYNFTGPAMFSRDLNKAFAGIDGTLLFVALGVVFVILLVVYRSLVLPVLTLISAIVALSGAILLVWHLADAGIVQLNGQVQGILFILVIGAATDYALLYISRYREELTHHAEVWDATKAAWKGSWEPIVAAGGTVILGLLCLLASDLSSNKALGPVGGIGIAFAVLAALTLLPTMLLLAGRKAFWPRPPKYVSSSKQIDYRKNHPTWTKIGRLVGRHPRRLWVGILVVLIAFCFFVPQLKAQGVSQSDLIIGQSEARDGQEMLNRHFPSGSGSPIYILAPADSWQDVVAIAEADSAIDTTTIITTDNGKTGASPVGRLQTEIMDDIRSKITETRAEQVKAVEQQIEAQMAGAPQQAIDAAVASATANIPSVDELAEKADPFADVEAKIIDDTVVLQSTLKYVASSVDARNTVQRLREDIRAEHPTVQIGGLSAIQLDTNTASTHDLKVIIPLILVAITIVLMLLLRAVVAPLLLLFTTVVSFGATIGIAALLFNNVWQFAGADPSVIIFGFVFLVALGIDYNIFLMTRVREETIKHGVREGTLKALIVTGGVITSAGVVLASTFAALFVIPILFLAQIAFIVAFGVLLDTLIVRSLLVPALTLEVGRPMWWPSKLSKRRK